MKAKLIYTDKEACHVKLIPQTEEETLELERLESNMAIFPIIEYTAKKEARLKDVTLVMMSMPEEHPL